MAKVQREAVEMRTALERAENGHDGDGALDDDRGNKHWA